MPDLIAPGDVWLVGAGPGDPDLLTRKAEKLIRAATTIFYDALVGPGVIDLIPDHVRRISVGKRSGRHSKDQREIDNLLVEAAQRGERVVRLKGGDPAIFGRSAEELAALRDAGIRVRICPGITAASAAAASAGVPLTLRGSARALTFVTAHAKMGEKLDIDWAAIADRDTTLAIYMGKAAAGEVAPGLLSIGLAPDTPALIVENASLPDERRLRTQLNRLAALMPVAIGDGPAILLIGPAIDASEVQNGLETAGKLNAE